MNAIRDWKYRKNNDHPQLSQHLIHKAGNRRRSREAAGLREKS